MKIINLLIVAFLLTTSAFADEYNESNKKGFKITPDYPASNQLGLKSGESTVLTGKLCATKINQGQSTAQCKEIDDVEQVSVKFFFPDATTEVTADVQIDKSTKEWSYSYTTPVLSSSNANTLSIVVGRIKSQIDQLLSIQAKIDKRIAWIDNRVDSYSGNDEKKKNVEWLNQYRTTLLKIRNKIDNIVDEEPDVLARYVQPLQVDNNLGGPLYYSTIFNGYKMSVEIPLSPAIEGESTSLKARIVNLRHKSLWFPAFSVDDDSIDKLHKHRHFTLHMNLKGSDVINIDPFDLGTGEAYEQDFALNNMSPNDLNSVRFYLNRVKFGGSKKPREKIELWGEVATVFPVAEDNVAPTWATSFNPLDSVKYSQYFPQIYGTVDDAFGRINLASIQAQLTGTTDAGSSVNVDVTQSIAKTAIAGGASYLLDGDINPLEEGVYSLSLQAADFAGNFALPNPLVRSMRIDRTKPVINTTLAGNFLTNVPEIVIPIEVIDKSPTITRILHNGVEVASISDQLFDFTHTMTEGFNTFVIQSVDAAGNVANEVRIENIELDTTPPVLTNVLPADGALLFFLDVPVSADSNEALSLFTVNSQGFALNADNKSFSGTYHFMAEGNHTLEFVATDLAGNSTTVSHNIEIVLKVINGDLISLSQDPNDLNKIIVKGAQGAARPGSEIDLDGGFFNRKIINPNNDGSFEVIMDFFTVIKITGTDTTVGRTDSVTLEFNVDTTLSGVVKDTDNKPLPGVTVTIKSSGQSSVTNESGTFMIADPIQGDQELLLDGTTIDTAVTGPNKKFSQITISVAIGNRQQNIIERPLYLAPMLFDGTETEIDENASTIVTSSHAPGVEIDIPAGVVTFPNGSKSGTINMSIIPASVTSVPVPKEAQPSTVWALEPSGVQFSERVKLTLPNIHEFPADLEVVILSKNSLNGVWEIDGVAKVSSDGSVIETLDGLGISHFSEVYAAPYAPSISEFGPKDRPGADTFNGALTTSVTMPSYKVLGQDVAPSLIYRSNWANPNTVVTNLFDVPKNVVRVVSESVGASSVLGSASAEAEVLTFLEPRSVDAEFQSEDFVSEKITFEGLPRKAVVSYALDLQNFENGIFPWISRYEMQFTQYIVVITTEHSKSGFGGARTKRDVDVTSRLYDEIYKSNIFGLMTNIGKVNSPIGRGWDIGGVQKIINPGKNRILIDEGNGSTSVYNLATSIDTLFYNNSGKQVDGPFLDWPLASFSDKEKVFDVDLSQETPIANESGDLPRYEGMAEITHRIKIDANNVLCNYYAGNFSLVRNVSHMFRSSTGDYLGLDKAGSFFKLSSANEFTPLIPDGGTDTNRLACEPSNNNFFYHGLNQCSIAYFITNQGLNGTEACRSNYFQQTGNLPRKKGFNVGSFNDTILHTPLSIIPKPGQPGKVIIADTGNYRIFEADTENETFTVIAGNGQTNDIGDGGQAVDASIYNPRGLAYDQFGNLYVSSGRGYIRKIDVNGKISRFAGKTSAEGGVFSDSAPAKDMIFSAPFGIVIDDANRFMYVADTGHHRVVSIDLDTGIANTVAGNFQCSISAPVKDGGSSLDANLCSPTRLGLDDAGNLLIWDSGHQRIRKVSFGTLGGGRIAYAPSAKDNSRLIKEADGSYTREFRNGTVIKYDNSGKQIASEDRTGRIVQYEYDAQNRLVAQVDPLLNRIEYSYSGDKLDSIVDPAGRVTTFIYDGNLLSQVNYPDSTTRKFSYNAGTGHITQEFDQRDNSTTYLYSDFNRLLKVIRPDLSEIQVTDGLAGTITNNFTGGNTGSVKSLDDSELADGIKDAKSNETTFRKDNTGYVSTIIDAADRVTTIERDEEGRPVKIIRPDESEVLFTYDQETGDLIQKTDSETGVNLSFNYDSFGNLLSQTLPNGTSVSNTYDPDTGLQLTSTNQLNQTSTTTYLSFGLVGTRQNSLNQVVSFEYDVNGNLVKQIDPEFNETFFTRDDAGNVTHVTNSKNQSTTNTYDTWNRLTSVTTAKNETTLYEYLPTGELSKIIDPMGNITTFTYNNMGRLIKKTTPLGFEYNLQYDNNGNVIEEVDPNGNIKTFEYDNLDQLTKRILPDNEYNISYDIFGNITQVTNNHNQIDFTYKRSEAGFLVETERTQGLGVHSDLPNHLTTYTYDVSGNRTIMSTHRGNDTYVYDIGNRLRRVTSFNNSTERNIYTYDNGNRIKFQENTWSTTEFFFDITNFLTRMIDRGPGGVVANEWLYQRDSIGNRTKITSQHSVSDLFYDDNNQLTDFQNSESGNEVFDYDSLGNRTVKNSENYIYDVKKQRLVEDALYIYAYDNNGNLSSRQTKATNELIQYIHNSENQLVKIEWYDSLASKMKEANYVYDALGRRVKKDIIDFVDSTKNHFETMLYDGQELITRFNQAGNVLFNYVHSTLRTDDVIIMYATPYAVAAGLAKVSSGFYFAKDAQGTIMKIVDSGSNTWQRYVYNAFGEITDIIDRFGNSIKNDPNFEPHFTYTNREYDAESGLYYYRARYYNADIGRFIQADPDPGNIIFPNSIVNRYIYSINDPLNLTDPMGRRPSVFQMVLGTIVNPLAFSLFFADLANTMMIVAWAAATAVAVSVVETFNDDGNVFDNFISNLKRNTNNAIATATDPDEEGAIPIVSDIVVGYLETKQAYVDWYWYDLLVNGPEPTCFDPGPDGDGCPRKRRSPPPRGPRGPYPLP